jgi:hypothetical protein
MICLLWLAAWGLLMAGCQARGEPAFASGLVLEWPETIRQNDRSEIVLVIGGPDESGPLPDLYQTHNVVAAAHLELPRMEAAPGTVREALQPGRTVTFRWRIRASQAGTYPGTVWLHLELVPKNGGAVEEVLVMARKIEIRAVTVFGLPADVARWVGAAGIAISILLGYPFFVGWARRIKDPHR